MGALPTSCTTSQADAPKSRAPQGVLTGKIRRGSKRPVERVDMPCAPEPVAGISLSIVALNGQERVAVTTDSQDVYSINLSPGVYHVDIVPYSCAGLAGARTYPRRC